MPSEWASERAPSTASGEQQALAPSVSRIGPELQRHADDLRPALLLEQGGNCAVDAAGHGDEHALGLVRGGLPLGGVYLTAWAAARARSQDLG